MDNWWRYLSALMKMGVWWKGYRRELSGKPPTGAYFGTVADKNRDALHSRRGTFLFQLTLGKKQDTWESYAVENLKAKDKADRWYTDQTHHHIWKDGESQNKTKDPFPSAKVHKRWVERNVGT